MPGVDGSLVPVEREAVVPTPVEATRAVTSCSIHSCWSAINELEGPVSSDNHVILGLAIVSPRDKVRRSD